MIVCILGINKQFTDRCNIYVAYAVDIVTDSTNSICHQSGCTVVVYFLICVLFYCSRFIHVTADVQRPLVGQYRTLTMDKGNPIHYYIAGAVGGE